MTQPIEFLLRAAFEGVHGPETPPRLRAAAHHAVFGGGGRIRPQLTLAVARACGNLAPSAARAAAVAIEFLHCASLVHDDLPCFDDAQTRRGRPSVHVAYGQPLAVLVGDGLIVGAFAALAEGCVEHPALLPPLLRVMTTGVGPARGIVAGQAWESEAYVDVWSYHRQKTGALFEAAVAAGAIAGGGDPADWTPLSMKLGETYQLADDIQDRVCSAASLGKPVRQDQAHGRPNAVDTIGISRAGDRLALLLAQLPDLAPPCPGADALVTTIRAVAAQIADGLVDRIAAEQPMGSPAPSVGDTQRLHP